MLVSWLMNGDLIRRLLLIPAHLLVMPSTSCIWKASSRGVAGVKFGDNRLQETAVVQ